MTSQQQEGGRGGRRGGGRSYRGGGRGRGRGGRGRGRNNNNNQEKSNAGDDNDSNKNDSNKNDKNSVHSTEARGGSARGGRGRGGGREGRGRGQNQPKNDKCKKDENDQTRQKAHSSQNQKGKGGNNRGEKGGGGGKGGGGKGNNDAAQTDSQKEAGGGGGKRKGQGKGGNNNKQGEKTNNNVSSSNNNTQKGGKNSQNDNKPKSKGGQKNDKKKDAQPLSPSIPPSQPQQTSDINYGRGQAITVLHVAEKPSIAQAIATALCKGKANYRSKSLPVHDFDDPPFPNAPNASSCTHKVTSVAGHVYSVDFPQKYQSWDSTDPAELFRAPIQRKPTKGGTVKHLSDEGKGVDFIVLWLDCDREGENIAFEVLDCCMHNMKGGGNHFDRVYRAYFSAINPSDIQKAYKALGKPDKNQSLAVDARQELDLKVGVAFSRFQTRYFQGRYGDLDSSVLSYGPCQTPTLGFCVQRHIDIETFKPEPFWTVEFCVIKRGRALRALWDSGRSFNKSKVEKIIDEALENGPFAKVKNVVTKDKNQGRPIPLNTVGLLKACSKALGIGPHSALQTAERLYLQGYLSYPRTESSTYPKSFDIKGMLQQQVSDSRWGSYVRELLAAGPNKARGGVDMGDHPPITPTRSAREGELSGDMARVYELVVRHCIASVSKDAVWRSTRVDFVVDSMNDKGGFTLRGKELVSPNFLAVLLHKEYGDKDDEDEEEDEEERAIPEFTEGEVIPLMNKKSPDSSSAKVAVAYSGEVVRGTLDIKQGLTTAPGYLTESELITKMEKHGIGTDASIPTHIENIQKRFYVSLETGRRLKPSKLGLVLAQGYHRIDSSLVLPQIRADIEGECNKIAKGLATKDQVVEKAIELFEAKFDYFVKNIEKMDVLFGASFSKLEDVGKPFTRCGLTRRYLQYVPGPPVRLYNKYTETVYPLPAGGNVKQWSGRTCSVDGCNFELCLYSVGQPERTFPLCPRCYNDPEWSLDEDDLPEDEEDREDEIKERQIQRISVAGKTLCLECPLPDHHPLIEEMTVSTDNASDGVLIVDAHFGPKWRLVDTRSPTIVHMPKCISKITILDEVQEELEVHKVQIEFKGGESPLPDKATRYKTCLATDEVLKPLYNVFHGSERTKSQGRGGRGRGRGRGGRGRGRGGGRGRR